MQVNPIRNTRESVVHLQDGEEYRGSQTGRCDRICQEHSCDTMNGNLQVANLEAGSSRVEAVAVIQRRTGEDMNWE